MIQPFFDTELRRCRLVEAAACWIGTPFVAHAALPQAGVDCVHLAAEVYKECGLFASYHFPGYTLDGGQHQRDSKVLAWLQGNGQFEPVSKPFSDLRPGDLLCFKLRRVEHHVGVMIHDTRFLHCWAGRTAAFADIQDPVYRRLLTAVFRPVICVSDPQPS